MRKLLIIQLKRAGDVLVTTPIIQSLRDRYPDAQIDFLTEKPFSTLLENHPALNSIRLFNKKNTLETWRQIRREKYDCIFDFQSSPRSALVCLMSGAAVTAGYRVPFWGGVYTQTVKRPGGDLSVVDGKFTLIDHVCGVPAKPPIKERRLVLTEAEKAWAKGVMPEEKAVGLIPTHRHGSRRWLSSHFAEVARRLRAEGRSVWLFWGPGEEAYVDAILRAVPGSRKIPFCSFRQMGALMARCRWIITNDNGPMHLATAVGTPTVTVYGPTEPLSWNPGGPRNRVVYTEGLSCLRCNLNVCPFNHECMSHVTPEQVLATALELERSLVS